MKITERRSQDLPQKSESIAFTCRYLGETHNILVTVSLAQCLRCI